MCWPTWPHFFKFLWCIAIKIQNKKHQLTLCLNLLSSDSINSAFPALDAVCNCSSSFWVLFRAFSRSAISLFWVSMRSLSLLISVASLSCFIAADVQNFSLSASFSSRATTLPSNSFFSLMTSSAAPSELFLKWR